jgi:hypothetical protein
MPKFDPTKPVQLRNGTPCRILATDLKGRWPLAIAYTKRPLLGGADPSEFTAMRTAEGRVLSTPIAPDSPYDVVNVPQTFKHEVWINIYPVGRHNTVGALYPSKESADRCASPDRIACTKVIIEGVEGDGLTAPQEP